MAQGLHISSQGEGIPLVLLHGWGLNSAIFKPLAVELSVQFKVITIDLPGYGYSHDCVPEDYSLASIANLVLEAVDEPAIYLGWSLGGLIASHIALTADHERVLGLITVASSPCFAERDGWSGINPTLLDGFHRQIADDIAKTLKGFLKIQAIGSPHLKEDIKLIQQLVMAAPLPNRYALDCGLNLLSNVDLRNELHRIEQPFLRVYGKMDGLVPYKIVESINTLAPASDVIVFDKASHAPFISNFQSFKAELTDWLMAQNLNS